MQLVEVGGCTSDANGFQKVMRDEWGNFFLRDHIRTRTHTSVGNVRGFKKIGGGGEEEVRKHKT